MTDSTEPAGRPEDVVLRLAADYPFTMSFDAPSPDRATDMFFDIPVDERVDTLVDEHEYDYAIAINRGRRLIETPHPDDRAADARRLQVDRDYRTAREGEHEEPYPYYDAISDILQAADFAGWDPAQLVLLALEYQQREKRDALAAAVATRGAIQPGPCSCECRGCEDNTYHCFKSETGCGWRRRSAGPAGQHRLGAAAVCTPAGEVPRPAHEQQPRSTS